MKLSRRGGLIIGCVCHPIDGDPHTFYDNLDCIWCGKNWHDNQTEGGVECTSEREEQHGRRDGSTGTD